MDDRNVGPTFWVGDPPTVFQRREPFIPIAALNPEQEKQVQEAVRVHKLRKYLKFIPDALTAASKSEDTTQVGCVVVDEDYCVRSSGWNGLPRKVEHLEERSKRPEKYSWTAHSEENAIAQAARTGVSLKGCTLIVTALYPCSTCARLIIQSGIQRVIAPDVDMPHRWATEWVISKQMFSEAGVSVYAYDPEDHTNVKVIV